MSVPEKIQKILDGLALGVSVDKGCQEVGISNKTFYEALRSNEDVEQEYSRARERRAHWRFEQLDDTIEELKLGQIDPNAARVIIQTRQWQMGKEKAKVYGDKVPEQVATVTNNMIITAQVLDLLGQDQLEALRVRLASPAQALPAPAQGIDDNQVLDGEYTSAVSE